MIAMIENYIPMIESGKAPRVKQDLSRRTEYSQRSPKDGLIDWNKPTTDLYNFIRAQTRPYSGAFTYYRNEKITIWRAEPLFGDVIPKNLRRGVAGQVLGLIAESNGIAVATKDEDVPLLITEISVDGRDYDDAADYGVGDR